MLTHGNGPQVGTLMLQHAMGEPQVPGLPLHALGAMTQGELGYLLQTSIAEIDPTAQTATILTRVRVDDDDPAFDNPTKPVGPFYSEEEAKRLSRERGWVVGEDSGRGWRCMVASPKPVEILELEAIKVLAESGEIVIAGGGGGIPVSTRGGSLSGMAAVIDKDRSSAELGIALGFDILVLLTAVPRVVEDFGTRWARPLFHMSAAETQRRLDAGEFPPAAWARRSSPRTASRPAAGAPRSSPTPHRCWPRSAARTAPGSRPSRRPRCCELACEGHRQPLRGQRQAHGHRPRPARPRRRRRLRDGDGHRGQPRGARGARRRGLGRRAVGSHRRGRRRGRGRRAQETLAQAEEELSSGGAAAAAGAKADREPPRSLESARRRLDDPNVALISVAGEYATLEAHRALSAGMHVFLFSDHVSLEDELELKQRGQELGLLVMGPGCGTAMLGNVGLGFANVVTSGPVGIVAAAGTGAQESACLLDAAGVGVSQIVGVGGRDLSADIGGIMFRQAMHMLAADDETETLLLVSKPPAPEVVASLAGDLPEGKRVVAAFVGWEGDGDEAPFEIHDTLEAAARAAAGTDPEDLGELEAAVDAARERSAGRRLLGLFSGGSLAHEAVTLLEPELGPLEGNVGHGPDERNGGHAVLDLGEEEYTQGRPHPMVDLDVRLGFLEQAAEDETVGCVLLDVVLGHGGHTDPASGLSDAIAAAAQNAVVLARVCGTNGDPQDATRQTKILRDAGAIVAPSNAAATRLALRAIAPAEVAA